MSITTRFWWIRHAIVTETDGKIYGAKDVNCDCSNTAQLQWLAEYLPTDAPYVTSGLKRTIQTAEAVKAEGYSGQCLATYPELNEQCFGAWEGLSYDEVNAQYGKSSQKFWLAPAGKRPDSHEGSPVQGESFHDLALRTQKGIQQILQRQTGGDIAVFAHGGTIRAAMAIALGMLTQDNPEALAPIFTLRADNLSLTRIDHTSYKDDKNQAAEYWRIVHYNMLKAAS